MPEKRPSLPLVFHGALAAVVTWPMLASPRAALLGDPNLDVWNHAWGAWWWAHALGQGDLPWRTALLHAPEGGVLWFIDPLIAAATAPLVGVLGVAAAWNLGLFASVVFTSWAGARFAISLGSAGNPTSRAGQAAAACALAGSAWAVAALHNGVSEALHLGPMALGLAWAEEAISSADRGRRWARAGAALGIAAVGSPYLGLAGGGALALRALLSRRGRAAARGPAWVGLGVALVVAAPAWVALAAQLGAPDALVRRPEGMELSLALHNAVDPRIFFFPHVQSTDLRAEGWYQSCYLGLVVLALAAVGARSRGTAPWMIAALSAALLALGPWLFWGGAWVTVGGERIPLPARALQLLLPELALTHPLRLAAPALVIAAGLAGRGVSRLERDLSGRLRAFAWSLPLVVLADGLLLSGAPWPLHTAPAEIPAVAAALGPGEGMVLDLPTDAGATMATSRYLYWQTAHGHPLPYAPDVRASTSSLLSDPSFRALAARCQRRPDEAARLGLDPSGPLQPERLRDAGVRWIALHPALDPQAAAGIEQALQAVLGPGERFGADRLWELR